MAAAPRPPAMSERRNWFRFISRARAFCSAHQCAHHDRRDEQNSHAPAIIESQRTIYVGALNLELPVVWDSLAADRARVQGTAWAPVAVQDLAAAVVGVAPSS